MTDDTKHCKSTEDCLNEAFDAIKQYEEDTGRVVQLEPTWAWLDGETFCPRTYEELLEFLKEGADSGL